MALDARSAAVFELKQAIIAQGLDTRMPKRAPFRPMVVQGRGPRGKLRAVVVDCQDRRVLNIPSIVINPNMP